MEYDCRLVGGLPMISLEHIRQQIEGSSEDARYTAWMELYTSEDVGANAELQRIITSSDPILKILFLRFLSHVDEEKSVRYILKILEDENPVVCESARKSFDKNQYPSKLKMLFPFVHSSHVGCRYFAIERLTQGGMLEVIDVLLQMMEKADEVLLLKILTGLRFLADKRMLPTLHRYLHDNREEVRFKTVLIYGAVFESGYFPCRKNLLEALKDPSRKIRRAVLWTFCRSPSKKDLELLFRISMEDPDPLVRQESLHEMGLFPTTQVIGHLLQILVYAKERILVLKAEGILLSMPQSLLLHGLKKVLKHEDQTLKNKAMLIFAEFEKNSKDYFDFIVGGFEKATDDKQRLPYIEALGALEDPRAVSILEKYLHASYLIAYATMNALVKIGSAGRKGISVVKYLEDEKLNPLLKQMVLKYLTKRGNPEMFTDNLVRHLISCLKSDNTNIRYLSAQSLVLSGRENILDPLFEMVLRETDPTSVKFLEESILKLLSKTPSLFITLIRQYDKNRRAVVLLFELMKRGNLSGGQVLSLLPSIFGAPLFLLRSSYKAVCVDFLFFIIFHRRLTLESVLEKLEGVPEKEYLLPLLVQKYKEHPSFAVLLSATTIEKWLQTESRLQKEAMIDLMGQSRGRSPIPFLVTLMCSEKFAAYHERAAGALHQILEAS
ncbi:MAG: HEAT repeat domain-containing protein [Deltaproteobacteria bacterium]|nr:HEAT repeat domain-containing protein [Deltaproteobacteria bacterium]